MCIFYRNAICRFRCHFSSPRTRPGTLKVSEMNFMQKSYRSCITKRFRRSVGYLTMSQWTRRCHWTDQNDLNAAMSLLKVPIRDSRPEALCWIPVYGIQCHVFLLDLAEQSNAEEPVRGFRMTHYYSELVRNYPGMVSTEYNDLVRRSEQPRGTLRPQIAFR